MCGFSKCDVMCVGVFVLGKVGFRLYLYSGTSLSWLIYFENTLPFENV